MTNGGLLMQAALECCINTEGWQQFLLHTLLITLTIVLPVAVVLVIVALLKAYYSKRKAPR